MLNRYDWKNIIKRIIVGVGIAFILFNINKCNAYAMVYKGDSNVSNVQSTFTGTISNGNQKILHLDFSSTISSNGNDMIGIKFTRLNFITNSSFNIENPEASWSSSSSTFQCTNGANGYCSTANISNNVQGLSTTLSGSFSNGAITINAYSYNSGWTNDDICYFSSEIEDTLLCPFKDKDSVDFIEIYISQSGYSSVNYNVVVSSLKLFYNYDSTEIVNGLGGVQTQQQQTNTILTSTDTTSSSNSANTGLNNMNSQITQKVDSLASVNTYNNIVNNFFTQINNSTCSPISLPMPFVEGKNIVLPCIGNEIQNSAPALWTFWRFMCAGIIGFALWGNLIAFIKGVVDPYNIGANNLPLGGGK